MRAYQPSASISMGAPDSFRGRYGTQFRRSEKDGEGIAHDLRTWSCAFRPDALSRVMQRIRQFGCTEHVRDALEVVCDRCEADFDLCTGQTAHQQTRMPEDTVFDRSEGMLDRRSPQPHHFWCYPFLHPIQCVFV